MQARPLPVLKISATVVLVGLVSICAQFFGVRWMHGIALFLGFIAVASLLVYHAWMDNFRLTLRNFRGVRVFAITLVAWLPFILLLLPGIALTLWIDDYIDAGLRKAEIAASDKVEKVTEQVEEIIQKSEDVPWAWYWPPDWFKEGTRIVERKVHRTIERDVLRPAPIWIRSIFAVVFAILRVSQLVLYCSIAFIFVRSFVFLFSRVALFDGTEIEFTLP